MLCWSCGKEIANNAVRCSHCEADVVSSPGEQEMDLAREFLDNMDSDTRSELLKVFESSASGEEFVNRIMIGECPQCGSGKTGDCEHDPDIGDISIGRCFDCGHVWCTICDSPLTPGEVCQVCSELDEGLENHLDDEDKALDRYHLLAAEIFGYSFANYKDHLGIGNERYEKLMPDSARLLERALLEHWPIARVAQEMFPDEPLDEQEVQGFLNACKNALLILNADDAAESFRNAVRLCIERAIDNGLDEEDAVEQLVTQICYRTSDLAVMLDMEGQPLSRYSRHLRRESDVDYYDGYFDE